MVHSVNSLDGEFEGAVEVVADKLKGGANQATLGKGSHAKSVDLGRDGVADFESIVLEGGCERIVGFGDPKRVALLFVRAGRPHVEEAHAVDDRLLSLNGDRVVLD